MSELSRSHTADIADTRFAAAIREAGRLAVRAMSGYGMAACGAKRTFARHRGRHMLTVEVGIPAGGMTRTEQDKGQATIIIVLPMVGFFRWGDQRKSARCCYRADDCAHRCGDTKS